MEKNSEKNMNTFYDRSICSFLAPLVQNDCDCRWRLFNTMGKTFKRKRGTNPIFAKNLWLDLMRDFFRCFHLEKFGLSGFCWEEFKDGHIKLGANRG